MAYEYIMAEVEAPIGMITLNRPKVLNALSPELIREVNEALERYRRRRRRARGRAHRRPEGLRRRRRHRRHGRPHGRRPAAARPDRPLGGDRRVQQAAHRRGQRLRARRRLRARADVRPDHRRRHRHASASPRSTSASSPAPAAPSGWPRAAGKYMAMEVILTGAHDGRRRGRASWAREQGGPGRADARRRPALARQIAEKAPLALRMAKESVLKRLETPLAEGLAVERRSFYFLFSTEDQKEGMHAFLEKRRGVFKGKMTLWRRSRTAREGHRRREAGVGWIRLNRPEKMNAIGTLPAQAARRRDEAGRAATTPSAVVVLTGSGRAFCSGADVTEMQGAGKCDRPRTSARAAQGVHADADAPAHDAQAGDRGMNGPAVGIGASYALACDIRIAVPETLSLEAFINIGLAPDGGVSWTLPASRHRGRVLEMFFTGKPLCRPQTPIASASINRVVPQERSRRSARAGDALAAQPHSAPGRGQARCQLRRGSRAYEEALEFEAYLQESCAARARISPTGSGFPGERAGVGGK